MDMVAPGISEYGSSAALRSALSLSKFGCVPFLFSTSSPKTPRAGLFVLSSIIFLIGPEAGAVLHHLKIYGFSELFDTPHQKEFHHIRSGETRIKIPSRLGANSKQEH
ncbi:hypothetical protein TNCV_4314641 [Trichonephila clavipes]|nr:hypothetical protein TNCV_4314641 [Trichonephila clavipes]